MQETNHGDTEFTEKNKKTSVPSVVQLNVVGCS
jgi:hypothetical protein